MLVQKAINGERCIQASLSSWTQRAKISTLSTWFTRTRLFDCPHRGMAGDTYKANGYVVDVTQGLITICTVKRVVAM